MLNKIPKASCRYLRSFLSYWESSLGGYTPPSQWWVNSDGARTGSAVSSGRHSATFQAGGHPVSFQTGLTVRWDRYSAVFQAGPTGQSGGHYAALSRTAGRRMDRAAGFTELLAIGDAAWKVDAEQPLYYKFRENNCTVGTNSTSPANLGDNPVFQISVWSHLEHINAGWSRRSKQAQLTRTV